MKAFLLLALFLLASPACAVDMTQPASVQVTVQDKDGHPLPQAAVTFGTEKISLEATGRGHFETRSLQPALDIFWTEHLVVSLAGFLPYKTDIQLYPGAQTVLPVTLSLARATRLHLRGLNGEPLAGISLHISGTAATLPYNSLLRLSGSTDAQGDYVFTHPPLASPIIVTSGPSYSVSAFRRELPDAPEITVVLSEAERPHPMRLTLLLPDGSPAAGWQVGPNAYSTGSGGIGGDIPTIFYSADALVQTGPDGTASFGQTEEHLIVLSPQGLPFLYSLHPETWLAGLHTVMLRLPALRRTQSGQLAGKDGKPAAHIALGVNTARSGLEKWQFPTTAPIGSLFTDAEGRYALPQYYGASYEYQAKSQLSAYDLTTAHATVTSYVDEERKNPADYKQVTMRFADEQGKPLPDIALDRADAYQKDALVSSLGGNGTTDQRGSHLFLPNTIDRVVITSQAHEWTQMTQTLAVSGTGDQEFTLTMPQSLHLKPLSGVLLDPHGKPVPGATMPLYHGVDLRSGNTNNDFLQFSTTTDAKGRFAFAAAPDSCEIDLYRFGSGQQPNLPGWIAPPQVTPQARHLTIRLRPFLTCTVRALLPPSVTTAPKEVYLESAPAKDDLPAYLFATFDPKAHTLLWNRIPPGTYTLTTASAKLPAAARISQPVTLKTHSETRIDLRDKAASFPQPPKSGSIGVYLTDDQGKPLSGAVVTLWTDQEAGERQFPADLTDENGQARLPLGIGQHGVIVAHVAGKLIGWMEVTGQKEASVSFGMQPAQTLTVPLKPLPLVNGKPPYDSREVSLRPVQMKPDEAQAVFMVLELLSADAGVLGDGPVPTIILRPDASGNCVAEDLPPGTYHLETGSDVTLPPGNVATEIRLP